MYIVLVQLNMPRWWNWYTHTVEGRGTLCVRVQVPPWALDVAIKTYTLNYQCVCFLIDLVPTYQRNNILPLKEFRRVKINIATSSARARPWATLDWESSASMYVILSILCYTKYTYVLLRLHTSITKR